VGNKKTEFKDLKDLWYKKLKNSGFEDIERDEYTLKKDLGKNVFRRSNNMVNGSWKDKQEYYYQAEHFLTNFIFTTELEKAIWKYHSEGLSYRDIADTLNKVNIKSNRNKVMRVIRALKIEMAKLNWLETLDETQEH
jgi:hypothetical protein